MADKLDLQLSREGGEEGGVEEQSCGTKPLTYGIRIELNCRASN